MGYPNFCDRKHFPETMPEIVCLCGSTRFWELFRDHGLRLTLENKIVLSIGVNAPDSMVLANPETEEGKNQKAMLDELHKRKIDIADRIFVLNKDQYIGTSTAGEIAYAVALGKTIDWLEEPNYEDLLDRVRNMKVPMTVYNAFSKLLEDNTGVFIL